MRTVNDKIDYNRMGNISVTGKFIEFEERYDLLKREVNSFPVWRYLREGVYNEIIGQGGGNVNERKTSFTLSKALKIIKNCIINPLLQCKQKPILVFTGQIRDYDGKEYVCRVTDYLIRALGDTVCSAELIFEMEKGHMEPCATKHLFRLDYVDVAAMILTKVVRRYNKRLLRDIKEECEYLSSQIIQEFNCPVDAQKLTREAVTQFYLRKYRRLMLKPFLKKVKPRIIVEVCSYSRSRMAINELAKEMGILVVELQHGIITPDHIGYNYFKKQVLQEMPEYLILFSSFWKEYARFAQKDENILPLGYPHFELMKKKFPPKKTFEGLGVIVISQHTVSQKLLNVIKEMIESLNELGVNYHIYYKLHPREDIILFRNDKIWEEDNIELVDNKKLALYELFAKSDIQIGVNSTALYEGLGYNLDTYIFDCEELGSNMDALISGKYVETFSTGEKLAEMIINSDKRKEKQENIFFAENALSNISSFINEKVGEKGKDGRV